MIIEMAVSLIAIGTCVGVTLKIRENYLQKKLEKLEEERKYEEKRKSYNTLYTCEKCGQKNRAYQLMLYHVTNNFAGCVHCEQRIGVTYGDELLEAIRKFDLEEVVKYYAVTTGLNIENDKEVLRQYENKLGSPSLLDKAQVKGLEKDVRAYNEMNQKEKKQTMSDYHSKGNDNTQAWVHKIREGTIRKTEERQEQVNQEVAKLQQYADPLGKMSQEVEGLVGQPKKEEQKSPQEALNDLVNNRQDT